MSANTTYYVDINSQYRDVERYPNPADFAVSFSTNTQTGYFPQGLPISPSGYFQQASIDPDFIDSNLKLIEFDATQYERVDNSLFFSGTIFLYYGAYVRFKNDIIFELDVPLYTYYAYTSFLMRIDIVDDIIPYVVKWCIFFNLKNLYYNDLSPSYFYVTNDNNIYFNCSLAQSADLVIQNEENEIITLISNINPPYGNDAPSNTSLNYTFLFDFEGNLGLYDNHNWGYHTCGSKTVGTVRNSIPEADNGKNLYIGLRLFPLAESYQDSTVKWTNSNYALYPRDIYTYTGIADNPLLFYHLSYTYDDDNVIVNPALSTGGFWVNTNSFTGISIINQQDVTTPSNITSIGYSDFCETNNTVYAVKNYFTSYTGSVNSQSTGGIINPDLPIQYYVYDKTGSQFTYITETSPGSYNGYMYPHSVSYGNDVYTFGRASFTGTETNSLVYCYKLTTSTNTVNKVATIGLTGANFTNSKIFAVPEASYIYVLCNDYDVFNVSNDSIVKGFVLRFNPATNVIEHYSEYDVLAASIVYQTLLEKGANKYLVVTYSSNSDTDFYDITNYSSITDVYTTTESIANSRPYPFKRVVNSTTSYFLASSESNGLANTLFNINDLNNITRMSDYSFGVVIQYVDKDGYLYSVNNVIYNEGTYYSLSFTIPPFWYGTLITRSKLVSDATFESVHYNINTSNTYTVPTGSNCITSFVHTNTNHTIITVLSQDYIQFYSIDNKLNLFLELQENISLGSSPNVLKNFLFENKQWFFICQSNQCLVYTIDLDAPLSFTYLETITAGWTIVDLNILNKEGTLTLILFNSSCDLNTYQYSSGFNYISTYNFVNGSYDSYGSSYSFYKTSTNTYYTFITINNTPLLNQANFVLLNISNLSSITTDFENSFLNSVGQGYKSTSVIQNGSNLMFGSYFSNPGLISGIQATELLTIPNFGSIAPSGLTSIGEFNGTPCFDFLFIGNRLHFICNRSNPGDPTEYLACYFVSVASPYGFSTSNIFYYTVELTSTCVDLISVNVGSKYISVSLLNNNSIYLYDITNPQFAGENQNLTKTVKTYGDDDFISFQQFFIRGSNYIHKILADGTSDWATYIGSTTSSLDNTGFRTTISVPLILDSSQQNLYVGINFNTRVQTYNYTSTGYYKSQQITNNNYNSNFRNSCIQKLNSTNGNAVFLLPQLGIEQNTIQWISYIPNENSIVFCGDFTSNISTFYNIQNAGNFINPTTVQKILIKTSNTSSFLSKINSNGTIQWSNLLYTDDIGKNVQAKITSSDTTKIIVIGASDTSTMRCIDSNGTISQILYSSIGNTSDRNTFMFVFNTNGVYQQSNLMIVGDGDYNTDWFRLYQNKSLNEIAVLTSAYFTNSNNADITYYNKDGTYGGLVDFSDDVFYNIISLGFYKYDSTYYADNGLPYSQIVFNQPTPYTFTGGYFDNYYMYIGGNQNSTGINKSFTIRDNFTGPNNRPSIILNNYINIPSIDRSFDIINNIPDSDNYYFTNISKSPLTSIIEYDRTNINTGANKITVLKSLSPINLNEFYYITYPYENSNKIIPVVDIEDIGNGEYLFTIQYTDDLQNPTGGLYYGPYLYLSSFNKSLYYNLQFFPGSIAQPVYFTVRLQSLTIPNRPLLNLSDLYGGSRTLNDMPFIYLSVYNVDDNDNYDNQIVNVVYDSTPLSVEPYPVFQIPVSNQSSTNNFATFSSDIQPIVKFSPGFYNLRIRLFDMNGNPLEFDSSSTKPSDLTFAGGLIPSYLSNVYLRMAFTKRQ